MTLIADLAQALSTDPDDLLNYIKTCPHRYKVYFIPKRNGDGKRTIAQPTKELKGLQRFVQRKYFDDLPVHGSVFSYRKDSNIANNAKPHLKNSYLLKADFKDFFPSIKPNDFIKHIAAHSQRAFEISDHEVIAKIFFYKPKSTNFYQLSIGAPSSPFISNTIMYDFDKLVSTRCRELGITYTRYADDLSFSTNTKGLLYDFLPEVKDAISSITYPTLRLNEDKTLFLSKKGNRHITGLVLSSQNNISIGREKKRYIKALVHQFVSRSISLDDLNYLKGYLAFCLSVEPEFLDSLVAKYGEHAIDTLLGRIN